MSKAKKQLVLAFFESETAADEAANQVRQWDKANKDIQLGAVGVLVKDDKGKVKTHKLGRRHTGVGAVLGAIAGAVSGGFTMVTGFIVGSIMGVFYRQGLGMSKDDIARIGSELDGGKAAVGVLVEAEEGAEVTAKLAELGGKPETHEVSEEALEQVQEAAEAMPEEPAEA